MIQDLDALNGTIGAIQWNQSWNIFDSSQNSDDLIDYVRGAEVSSKKANLKVLRQYLIFKIKITNCLWFSI